VKNKSFKNKKRWNADMAKKKREMRLWAFGVVILAAAIIAVALTKEGFEKNEPGYKYEQPSFHAGNYPAVWCSPAQMNLGGIVNMTIFGTVEKEIRGKKYETCHTSMDYAQGRIESWMAQDSSFQFTKFYDEGLLSFAQTSWKNGNVSCWQKNYYNGTVEISGADECLE